MAMLNRALALVLASTLLTSHSASQEAPCGQGLNYGTFYLPGLPTRGQVPGASAVRVGDLDDDGITDLVSTAGATGEVLWHRGIGNGGFAIPEPIGSLLFGASSLGLADLDGDSDLDVVVGANSGSVVAWIPNEQNGEFSLPRVISTAVHAVFAVAVGDLDGDGDVDVASASANDGKLAWYSNDGLGNFGAQQILASNVVAAIDIKLADIDGDEDLDVVGVGFGDNTVQIFENLGGGVFGPRNVVTTSSFGPASVQVADIDGDGDQDLAVASLLGSEVAWYERDANGGYGAKWIVDADKPGARDLVVGDFDDDGDIDIAALGLQDTVVTHYNSYPQLSLVPGFEGCFEKSDQLVPQGAAGTSFGGLALTLGNLDGDEDLDIVAACEGASTLVRYEYTPDNYWNTYASVVDTGELQAELDSNHPPLLLVVDAHPEAYVARRGGWVIPRTGESSLDALSFELQGPGDGDFGVIGFDIGLGVANAGSDGGVLFGGGFTTALFINCTVVAANTLEGAYFITPSRPAATFDQVYLIAKDVQFKGANGGSNLSIGQDCLAPGTCGGNFTAAPGLGLGAGGLLIETTVNPGWAGNVYCAFDGLTPPSFMTVPEVGAPSVAGQVFAADSTLNGGSGAGKALYKFVLGPDGQLESCNYSSFVGGVSGPSGDGTNLASGVAAPRAARLGERVTIELPFSSGGFLAVSNRLTPGADFAGQGPLFLPDPTLDPGTVIFPIPPGVQTLDVKMPTQSGSVQSARALALQAWDPAKLLSAPTIILLRP